MADDDTKSRGEAEKRPLVDGYGQTEFNVWKQHPISKLYFKYMNDRASDAQESAVDAWLAGRDSKAFTDEARGVVNISRQAAAPSFEDIFHFYEERSQITQSRKEADNEQDFGSIGDKTE